MNGLFTTSTLNHLRTATMAATLTMCGDGLKYLVDKGLELAASPPSLIQIKESVSGIWSTTKHFFKSIEPYQPLAASLTIVGKALWKTKTKNQLKRNISDLRNRLAILKQVHQMGRLDCSQEIRKLREELQSKKDDRIHSTLSIIQLGSLMFSHPGSNVWNSANTLFGRLFSLRKTKLSETPMTAALGSIATLGTTTSLLKISGVISGDHPLSHLIIGASFVGMAIETGLMIKNWLFR